MIHIDELKKIYKDKTFNKKININESDSETGNTYLHFACSYYNNDREILKLIEWLIVNGANIDAVNNYGDTPLHIACFSEWEKVVNLLIEYGADVNALNNDDLTPLHIAYYYNEDNQIKDLLLNNNADVNIELEVSFSNNFGLKLVNSYSPLAFECHLGNKKAAKKLIDLGADVNKPNSFGNNLPLCIACSNGNEEIAKLLLENGASLNKAEHNGKTPLDFANESDSFHNETERFDFINSLKHIWDFKKWSETQNKRKRQSLLETNTPISKKVKLDVTSNNSNDSGNFTLTRLFNTDNEESYLQDISIKSTSLEDSVNFSSEPLYVNSETISGTPLFSDDEIFFQSPRSTEIIDISTLQSSEYDKSLSDTSTSESQRSFPKLQIPRETSSPSTPNKDILS